VTRRNLRHGALYYARHAFAQSENIVVTATRLVGVEAGSNVSVIDAETIAARNPAVWSICCASSRRLLQQSGGRAAWCRCSPRRQANFALVLLDGVKANDPTNTRGGSYDFSTLDLNDITRIEFVRGPASAIYGSDAWAGDQHHHKTRRRHAGGEPDGEGGSFGYARVAGHVGGPIGGATGNLACPIRQWHAGGRSSLKSTALDGALHCLRSRA